MTNTAEYPDVTIRNLRPADLAAVIAIDALDTGLRRAEFYQLKLKQALSDTGIMVSLGAELDGLLVGFLLARVYYGEFGVLGRVAVLDAIGVHPDFQGAMSARLSSTSYGRTCSASESPRCAPRSGGTISP